MTAIKTTPQKRRSQSLSAARTQFVASVNQGIEELIRYSGYGRERATKTLLRELSRGGQAPSENEVRITTLSKQRDRQMDRQIKELEHEIHEQESTTEVSEKALWCC